MAQKVHPGNKHYITKYSLNLWQQAQKCWKKNENNYEYGTLFIIIKRLCKYN